jgi:CubicO group peptidase (beta-lactamase class C family)
MQAWNRNLAFALVLIVHTHLAAEWPPEVSEIRYLSEADGSFQPAMFYAPKSDEPVPLLVGLHTWSSDYHQTSATFGGPYAAWCIERGWAFIGPNFRGPNKRPEAGGSELVVGDIASAVEYMRATVAIDAERVYAVGVSGGGHAGLLMAGRRPDLWAGVSAWVGINDLAAWHGETKAAGLDYWKDVEASCGGPPGTSPEIDNEYLRRSPRAWLLHAAAVPLDINAGIHDGHTGSVPIRHSLDAFNLLARPRHRFAPDEIDFLVKEAKVPTHLTVDILDPAYGDKRPLLRRESRAVRLTIFDGGHEIVPQPALEWLAKQRRRPRLERQVHAVDDFLVAEYDAGRFHGVVLVADHGDVIYHEAFGDATVEGDAKLRRDSVFRLASVSKTFTGMAAVLLHEEGKLRYEDDVRRYIPEFPYEGIRIRQLLWHTSGLPDYIALLEEHWDVERRGQADRKVATNREALALLIEHHPPPRFAPGAAWEYSNTGYATLGLIVERVSGQPFGTFLKKRVFEPLGMKDTLLFSPLDAPQIPRRAYGFESDEGGRRVLHDHHFLNGMYGDGAVFSTAADLLKWDQALYGVSLAPRAALESAFMRGALEDGTAVGYGFGWHVGQRRGGRLVSHRGAWVGFRTVLYRDLGTQRTMIVLTNNTHAGFGKLVRGILHRLER